MEKQNDNDEIQSFEEALSKYLFGGQLYYHHRYGNLILF